MRFKMILKNGARPVFEDQLEYYRMCTVMPEAGMTTQGSKRQFHI